MRPPLLLLLAVGAAAQSTVLPLTSSTPLSSSPSSSLLPSSLSPSALSVPAISQPPVVYTTITRGSAIPHTTSGQSDPSASTSLSEFVVTITLASTAGASGWATPSSEASEAETETEARLSAASSSSPNWASSARTAAIVLGVLCGLEALVIAYLAYRSRALAQRARRLAAVYPSAPAVTDVRRQPSPEATDVEDARVPHWLADVEPRAINSRVPTWLAGVEPGSPPNEKVERAMSPLNRSRSPFNHISPFGRP